MIARETPKGPRPERPSSTQLVTIDAGPSPSPNARCRTVLIPRLRLRSAGSVDELVEQPARPDDLCVGGSDRVGQFTVGHDHDHVTASAMAAIVSSPSRGACTTSTPSTSTSSAPARARPLSTMVQAGSRRVPRGCAAGAEQSLSEAVRRWNEVVMTSAYRTTSSASAAPMIRIRDRPRKPMKPALLLLVVGTVHGRDEKITGWPRWQGALITNGSAIRDPLVFESHDENHASAVNATIRDVGAVCSLQSGYKPGLHSGEVGSPSMLASIPSASGHMSAIPLS
jgi:hypothetical protein